MNGQNIDELTSYEDPNYTLLNKVLYDTCHSVVNVKETVKILLHHGAKCSLVDVITTMCRWRYTHKDSHVDLLNTVIQCVTTDKYLHSIEFQLPSKFDYYVVDSIIPSLQKWLMP